MMQNKNQRNNSYHRSINKIAFVLTLFTVITLCTLVFAESENELTADNFLAGTALSGSSYNARQLTLEDRIACQEAIERVYWQHRIWPGDNKQSKPSFESVIPKEEINAKVADIIRKSNALEYYWHRPITGEQLQDEMNRIAKNTRDPKILKELWAALGNEPHLIAECLARPMLVNRLISTWYSYDERFHQTLKMQAQNDLLHYSDASQMKWMSGQFSEREVSKIKQADRRTQNEAMFIAVTKV